LLRRQRSVAKEELTDIEEFLGSVADGPATLVLEGEAGVGKTTLWRVGVDRARQLEIRVLTASPVEAETKLSLSTLGDLLGDVLGDVLPALPAPQRRALEIALLLEEGDAQPTDPRTLGVSLVNSLTRLADSTSVLLAIDDVQWVDPASTAVLAFALRRLGSNRVSVLATKRLREATATAESLSLSLGPPGSVRRLRVGPLSLGALHHLLNERLGLVLSRPKLRRLHELCAGNPFYGLELGRAIKRGMIDLTPGESLPDTLAALVEARVALLPTETRSALLVAAAASQPTCELVAQVIEADAMVELQPALTTDVIEIEDGRIRFSHPLVASGIYGAASRAERKALHHRLAALSADPEERARHLALAEDDPNWEVAEALDDAAIRAHRRGAVGAAAELSELARQFTPEGRTDEWHERTVRAGLYAFEVGESGQAQELFEGALVKARPGPQRGNVLYQLGKLEVYWGDRRRAVEIYRQGLDDCHEDPAGRSRLEEGLANALFLLREQLPEASEHARLAVSLANEVGARSTLSTALGIQGLIDALLAREGWRATLQAGMALDRVAEPARIAASAPMCLARALMWVDELDEARLLLLSLLERAYERVEESGLPWVLAQLAYVEYYSGHWREATERADDAMALALQTSQNPQRLYALGVRALVRSTQGDIEGARADAEAVLGSARDQGVMIATILAVSALGLLELGLGRCEAAYRLFAPLDEQLEQGGVREPGSARFMTDEVEALIGLGRVDEAEVVLERVEGRARTLDRASMLAACLRCRGLVAAARGDLDGALASLEQAVQQHDRAPIPFDRARTLLALGSIQRRARLKRSARTTLDEARGVFEALAAQVWAERAQAEIARIGGRGPATAELTPSERRIASLVAEGRSNKEVAGALVVTVKTVESHLSRIYAKLGIHSRAELAHRFATERIRETASKE
jgi:DNA-binding CsgD family transcriptional regulator